MPGNNEKVIGYFGYLPPINVVYDGNARVTFSGKCSPIPGESSGFCAVQLPLAASRNMNYPAASCEVSGFKKIQLLPMQLFIFGLLALRSDIIPYRIFITMLANCIYKISFSPKLSSP